MIISLEKLSGYSLCWDIQASHCLCSNTTKEPSVTEVSEDVDSITECNSRAVSSMRNMLICVFYVYTSSHVVNMSVMSACVNVFTML